MLIGSACRNNITMPGYKKSGNSRLSIAEYCMPQKCVMPDEFYYFFTARCSGLVTLMPPWLWNGEFYIFWIGLECKNKTKLLEARLSIRSINNLDDFFQSCVFVLWLNLFGEMRDFKPHRNVQHYAYKSGSGFKGCWSHIYRYLCPPPPLYSATLRI
jgi:hypothetical protein